MVQVPILKSLFCFFLKSGICWNVVCNFSLSLYWLQEVLRKYGLIQLQYLIRIVMKKTTGASLMVVYEKFPYVLHLDHHFVFKLTIWLNFVIVPRSVVNKWLGRGIQIKYCLNQRFFTWGKFS